MSQVIYAPDNLLVCTAERVTKIKIKRIFTDLTYRRAGGRKVLYFYDNGIATFGRLFKSELSDMKSADLIVISNGKPDPLPQKAEGVLFLTKHSHIYTPPTMVITFQRNRILFYNTNYEDWIPIKIKDILARFYGEKMFVRPCPLIPRPGVIESEAATPETLYDSIRKLARVMRQYGEKPVMILQPLIRARYSAVVHLVDDHPVAVVGLNNNGVTAGTSPTLIIPTSCNAAKDAIKEYQQYSGHYAALELVYSECAHAVQLRRELEPPQFGTTPPGSICGFLPYSPFKVLHVTHASIGDELDAGLATTPGAAVVEPGGNPASHIAAQCRALSIAYFTTEPSVGEIYSQVAPNAILNGIVESQTIYDPMSPDLRKAFWDGAQKGLLWTPKSVSWSQAIDALPFALHQWLSGPLNNPEIWATLAGMFATVLARSLTIICAGEARHAPRQTKGNSNEDKTLAEKALRDVFDQITSRSNVYSTLQYSPATLDRIIEANDALQNMFEELEWDSQFGGSRWAEIAALAKSIAYNVKAENIYETVKATNAAENIVHNNGWALNKIAHKEFWNSATKGEAYDSQQALEIGGTLLQLLHEPTGQFNENIWEKLSDSITYITETLLPKPTPTNNTYTNQYAALANPR